MYAQLAMMATELEEYRIRKDKASGYGSSLPVPSVQEIVRNDANNVAKRCIKTSRIGL